MKTKVILTAVAAIAMFFTACGPGEISSDGSGTVKEGGKYSNGRRSGDLGKWLDETDSYSKMMPVPYKLKSYNDEAAKTYYDGTYSGDGSLYLIHTAKQDADASNTLKKSAQTFVYYKDNKPVLIKVSATEYPGEGKLIFTEDRLYIKDGVVVECFRDKAVGKNISGMQQVENIRYALDGDAQGFAKKILADFDAAKAKLEAAKSPDEIAKDSEAITDSLQKVIEDAAKSTGN